MKLATKLLLLSGLLVGSPLVGQVGPVTVSVVELLASPEKFDGKEITVRGFLRIERQPHHAPKAFLYLHQEDAKNLLFQAVFVGPSKQMLRDEEKLDSMYVTLTGMFHAVKTVDRCCIPVIRDVRSCVRLSDPNRPIGEKGSEKKD